MNLKKSIRKFSAEQRAFKNRRNPITLQTRLAVGIDHDDLSAALFCVIHVFRGHRLIVRRVAADENEQIRAEPILIRAGRSRNAEHLFERDRAGRMANARRVIDIVGVKKSCNFLRDIINFIGKAARGEIKCQPLWRGLPNTSGNNTIRLFPTYTLETIFAFFSYCRIR